MSEGMDELPGKPRPSEEYPEFAKILMNDPGKWYPWRWPLKPKATSQVQHRIKMGVLKAFRPSGFFDAKVREGVLYVRYIGEHNK